jgi:hypothetical protein
VSFDECAGYFRRLWQHALRNGQKPGERVAFGQSDLMWLVQGHPRFSEMTLRGFSHFTFRPDGRGNHRFVLVDAVGKEHPFSTRTSLTGFETPLRAVPEEDDPLGGLAT